MSSETGASWVDGADGGDGFGLNHLPYGAFQLKNAAQWKFPAPHLCVRIGDMLLDLAMCEKSGLFDLLSPDLGDACAQATLNSFLALGAPTWQALRECLTELLSESATATMQTQVAKFLHRVDDAELFLPVTIGNYTDFYASVDHARRVGEIFRPDNPLLPNYKHMPIGYHGRASSIVVSGTDVRRPWGQSRPAEKNGLPDFGPSAALDYELELAFIVGNGNPLGEPIPIARAREHLFGVALLNDWSARDIQAWEYQPLGPFLGKSFATSLSPWITPLAALEPFRVPAKSRLDDEPLPPEYLRDRADENIGGLSIEVSASLSTLASRAVGLTAMELSRADTRHLYWTSAQMVAHHTSNGCNLVPGDVLATGTISGPQTQTAGCLLELTGNGVTPLQLPNGEVRNWLVDGDEITLSATCAREGFNIVLGSCMGRIAPACGFF